MNMGSLDLILTVAALVMGVLLLPAMVISL